MFIDPVFGIGPNLIEFGHFDPAIEHTLSNELRPGMTFVDLGANEGYFTVQGARLVGQSGRAIAVEPQDRLIPIIQGNLAINNLDNVTLVHAAVSDFNGSTALHLPVEPAVASIDRKHTWYAVQTQQTETMTIASLFVRCGVYEANLMKIDIEGAEYKAVLGSREIFQAHRVKVLALDLHPALLGGGRTVELIKFVESCHYRRDERYGNTVWRAPEAGST
jgi:FkbM family methyltransferase